MSKLLIDAACAAAWLLILAPAVIYLFAGWAARRDRLRNLLTPKKLGMYFALFRPSLTDPEADHWKDEFERCFARQYGRRHYIVPLILLGFLAGAGMWATARSLHAWTGLTNDSSPAPAILIAAFLGAYIWVVQDQLRRFRNENFTAHDVYACSFRFLFQVPLAYCLPALVESDKSVPLAFLLGTLPTGVLMTAGRRIVSKWLKFGESEETGETELIQLQCVGRSHAERFEDEGYLSIAQLAWADPVDITLRTNFDFFFVFDCQNQALLWVYLGPKVKDVYKYSLRGAQEATYLLERLKSEDEETKKAAWKALSGAAIALYMDPESLRCTLAEVKDDPYTKFLCALWEEKPGTV